MRNNMVKITNLIKVAFTIVAFSISNLSYSCEKLLDISKEQIREINEQIKSAQPLDLEAIFSYETLVCAKSSAVRDYARRIGLSSKNDSIRSYALFASLAEKESFTLETFIDKNSTEAQERFVKNNPFITYSIFFIDQENSCLSVRSVNGGKSSCISGDSISIQGDTVTLNSQRQFIAQLKLKDNNTLVGRWSDTSRNSKHRDIAVRVQLQ